MKLFSVILSYKTLSCPHLVPARTIPQPACSESMIDAALKDEFYNKIKTFNKNKNLNNRSKLSCKFRQKLLQNYYYCCVQPSRIVFTRLIKMKTKVNHAFKVSHSFFRIFRMRESTHLHVAELIVTFL